MKIAEVFYSIQGEGMLTGMPSVFIRFAGCNLCCAWCDTKYASWDPETEPWTMETVLAEIQNYDTKYAVITGGEPTIHSDLPELTQRLKALNKHITIETNGTNYQEGIACDLISMSPKLKHSIPDPKEYPKQAKIHTEQRLNIESFRNWIDNCDYQLKFVFCSRDDVKEIQELLASIDRDIPADRILLMPEGFDTETIRKRNPEVVAVCREYGYRYCCRLHIDLFGNAKGI